jgi:hypothetical protein
MTVVEFQVEFEVSSVRTKQVTTHLQAFNRISKYISEDLHSLLHFLLTQFTAYVKNVTQ